MIDLRAGSGIKGLCLAICTRAVATAVSFCASYIERGSLERHVWAAAGEVFTPVATSLDDLVIEKDRLWFRG